MIDLKRFRKDNRINQKELADKLGVTQSFISQIENGKDPMPYAMMDKISEIYKNIDLKKYEIKEDWIRSNLDYTHDNSEIKKEAIEVFLSHLRKFMNEGGVYPTLEYSKGPGKSETIKNELNPKVFESHVPVKVVTTKARAGYAGAYYSDEYLNDMPTLLMESDHEYKGKYLAFEVDGDSMEPEYIKGDIVICREIKRELWQYKLHINEWDFVIAHGTKGIMLKQIIDHDIKSGEIICHSLNSDNHPDFKLNLREVAYLYNVVEVRRPGRNKRRNR